MSAYDDNVIGVPQGTQDDPIPIDIDEVELDDSDVEELAPPAKKRRNVVPMRKVIPFPNLDDEDHVVEYEGEDDLKLEAQQNANGYVRRYRRGSRYYLHRIRNYVRTPRLPTDREDVNLCELCNDI